MTDERLRQRPHARLVGTWGARTADELLGALRGPGAAASDLIELRLDLPGDALARVAELVAASPKPVVATCRRASDGGGCAGTESARIDVLARAADAGAAWLDVEHDVADADVGRLRRTGAKLLRSRHVETAAGLDAHTSALLALPGDAAKYVVLHGGAGNALSLLTSIRDAGGRLASHLVDVPFTRAASAALGAPLVYAALQPGGTIGLAIPTVLTLRRRDRFDRLVPGAPLFVLLGGNVEGSVSPQMLNAAFEAAGRDIVALRWSCDDPGPALEAIRRFAWAGAAVTIPHKATALAALVARGANVDAKSAAFDAVNTVVAAHGTLHGRNSDHAGLIDALTPHLGGEPGAGRSFLVLGAGGAARAAIPAAHAFGMRAVVCARRPEEAASAAGVDDTAAAVTLGQALASRPAAVIDATPAGPPGGTPFLDPALLREKAVVLDMAIYARPTALLAAAARAGHVCVPGFDMLVAQADRQLGLLGSRTPMAATMRPVGESWLRRRDAPLVLVGLRCAGKTTVGERLATLLDRPFLDTDREIARRAGRPVDDMLRAGDEPAFRALEETVLRDAMDATSAVIACGGGAALHAEAFAALARWGDVVLLDAPDDVLLARRAASPRVPLTALPPADEVAAQRAARMPVYRAAARLVVDVSTLDAEAVATRIAAWWDALPVEHWTGRPAG